MEMISLPLLLTKKLLDQRNKQFKLILMHPKKSANFTIFFVLGACVCIFKKYTFLAPVIFVNSVFIKTDV